MSFKTESEWRIQERRRLRKNAKPDGQANEGTPLYSILQTEPMPQDFRHLTSRVPDTVADDVMSFHENYYMSQEADCVDDGW
ncbi:hypothetical protein [Rosistilla oblonga]|uniref:hypothetical protein n=1 Tax=Rosistilla oblonga TaxID=2527990 RepID=UPI003A969664